jgi:hypothetical protein
MVGSVFEEGSNQVQAFIVRDVGGGLFTAFPSVRVLDVGLAQPHASGELAYMRYICLYHGRSDSSTDRKGRDGHVYWLLTLASHEGFMFNGMGIR